MPLLNMNPLQSSAPRKDANKGDLTTSTGLLNLTPEPRMAPPIGGQGGGFGGYGGGQLDSGFSMIPGYDTGKMRQLLAFMELAGQTSKDQFAPFVKTKEFGEAMQQVNPMLPPSSMV